MNEMPIDLASVNWVYVGVLAIFVFVTSLLGALLTFQSRAWGAFLSAVLFVIVFVLWSYYPHNLPLPTRLTAGAEVEGPPAGMPTAAPEKPSSPITDVTPPQNPVTDVTPPQNPVTDVPPQPSNQ
jgi:hypothetical protein